MWHADKHIVKMILELAQLLYVVWAITGDEFWRQRAPCGGYKTTHVNHPIAIWMRQSKANYIFAVSFAHPMLEEYTRRYGKIHGCQKHLDWLISNIPPYLPDNALTQMPQAMPDEFKVNNQCGTMEDTVAAYKAYYIGFKLKTIKITYTNTEWPEWLPKPLPVNTKYITLNIIRQPPISPILMTLNVITLPNINHTSLNIEKYHVRQSKNITLPNINPDNSNNRLLNMTEYPLRQSNNIVTA